MKQLLATLTLCFSVTALQTEACADQLTRMPWLDRASNSNINAPLQVPQKPNIGSFDFGAIHGTSSPWMGDMVKRLKEASPIGENSEQADRNYDIQVFISSGMPEGVLRQLFRQAMDYPAGRVRFVVRGFTPQHLGPLVAKLRGMFPDPNTEHIALEVDPNAFKAYKVEAVPVFLVREKDKWFEVQGEQSLQAAQNNVKNRSKKVVGELFAITEPDILAIMQERAKNFDWKPVLARAQSRIAKNLKPGFDLPTASIDTTKYVVPTFTVPHDITGPSRDGKSQIIFGRAGQQINLLEYTRLQVPVIVFDPSDLRQIAMVKRWVAEPELRNADLFVVGDGMNPRDERTPIYIDLEKSFRHAVYPWLAKLGDRMGVEAVPTIVEQEGQRLRVRTFNPENR